MGSRKNTQLATSGKGAQDRQFVRALARGMEALKAFQPEDRGLSNAEIACRTGFPKPTVSRLTFTLLSLGYLHLDADTGRYSLHPHILSLGYPVLQQLSIREVARPLMQELADYCRGAVALGVRDGPNMIVIERARHQTMTTVPVDIGIGRDIATTALGRAYIAGLGDPQRDAFMEQIEPVHGDRWPAVKQGVEDALASFRQHGYSVSVGDWSPDYNAVGAPLKLSDGTILAFNCGGVASRITAEQLPDLGQRLVTMVNTLARTQNVNT